MTASEVITVLQKLIAEHGDCDVIVELAAYPEYTSFEDSSRVRVVPAWRKKDPPSFLIEP